MNVAMELRKCCNHPFLLRGVRDEVLGGLPCQPSPELLAKAGGSAERARFLQAVDALVASSGKMVFLDKLLPKLQVGPLRDLETGEAQRISRGSCGSRRVGVRAASLLSPLSFCCRCC